MKRRIRDVWADDSGQGMAEYTILIAMFTVPMIGMDVLLIEAVTKYLKDFYFCISLPIP